MSDPFNTEEYRRPRLTTAIIKIPETRDATIEGTVQKYGKFGYRLTTTTPLIGYGGTTDYILFTFELTNTYAQ